ncbi:MAG: TetR/AcrR family transcriptional regulator [Solirubrobacteraceae bacterium]
MTAALTPKGAATRARLLDAAARELADDGGLELATVAARVGVAPSVPYRYFGSKDGLVAAVVDGFYDEYEAAVFNASDVPGGTWLEREQLRIDREIAFFYAHPLGRAVAGGLLHEAAATRADAERLRAHTVQAARNIRAGQRAGELDRGVDADLAAAAIMGAIRSTLAQALSRRRPPPARRVAELAHRLGAAALRGDG